jgi:hypothetical protein
MGLKKIIIGGCLIGASFFVGCQSQQDPKTVSEASETTNQTAEQEKSEASASEEKDLIMYEASELAILMRDMYKKNLDLRQQIIEGDIPESFPEDFRTIHTANATEELNETFKNLAVEYIANMESITKAATPKEGIAAYNVMINTCASCHMIYCQGPLAKIKRMRIKSPGTKN